MSVPAIRSYRSWVGLSAFGSPVRGEVHPAGMYGWAWAVKRAHSAGSAIAAVADRVDPPNIGIAMTRNSINQSG